MQNFWGNFLIEIGIFSLLGVLYYFYQRRKILHYENNKGSIVMGMILQSCLAEREEVPSSELDALITALDDYLHNRVSNPPVTLLNHFMQNPNCSPELKEVIAAGITELED